jgi:hypothetical protein
MASRNCLIAILLLMAGCQAPWIQYPQLQPRSPAAERASFSQHDPLPDDSIGPDMNGRPRESFIQRGEPRRILEASIPTSTPGNGSGASQSPLSDYPATVVP